MRRTVRGALAASLVLAACACGRIEGADAGSAPRRALRAAAATPRPPSPNQPAVLDDSAAPDAGAAAEYRPAAPPPPGFATADERLARCGDAEIVRDESGGFLQVARNGRRVWEPPANDDWPYTFEADWCFDVSGDGRPELHVVGSGSINTGQIDWVISLGPPTRTLLAFESFGAQLEPVDLGTGAPWPLFSLVMQPNGYEWCATPAAVSFPTVLALKGGRYVRATRRFPDLLRSIRSRALTELSGPSPEDPCQLGYEVLTASLALGDWPTIRETLAADRRADLDRNRRLADRLFR